MWYIYNVETRKVVAEYEDYQTALDACDEWDDELYGLTGSPAFGTNDGLEV